MLSPDGRTTARDSAAAPLDVVLVEDHADYREQLRCLLNSVSGVRVVHTADSDSAAIQWLAGNPRGWNLLVLDIFLTGGNGFRVLRACEERHGGQSVVFLTSYMQDPAPSQALALGADAVFDKVTGLGAFLNYARELRERLSTAAHA